MSQQELLSNVIRALEGAGVPYMLTGSLVSSAQGEPRATHDLDVVVALTPPDVPRRFAALDVLGGYVDELAMQKALHETGMFNYIDGKTGLKVDFWTLTAEPFDVSRFSRRRSEPLLGLAVSVSAPEDTILAKLRWARLAGGSEKQFTDALRVFEVQGNSLDRVYLDRWAAELEVADAWRRIQEEGSDLH